MGLRFRKSAKIGPFRVTASKSGISYSVGTKGYRVTKTANGKIRQTASIPGTGISYVTEKSISKKNKTNKINTTPITFTDKKQKILMPIEKTTSQKILVCLGGGFGLHYFLNKRYMIGFLYLATGGLLYMGWIVDIIKAFTNKPYLFEFYKKQMIAEEKDQLTQK